MQKKIFVKNLIKDVYPNYVNNTNDLNNSVKNDFNCSKDLNREIMGKYKN